MCKRDMPNILNPENSEAENIETQKIVKNPNCFISILGSLVLLLSASSLVCQTLLRQIGPSLEYPWGMDFLNQNSVLVTERTGKIFKINIQTGESSEISGVPKVVSNGQGGLLDLIVEQTKAKKGRTIYFCYSFLRSILNLFIDNPYRYFMIN